MDNDYLVRILPPYGQYFENTSACGCFSLIAAAAASPFSVFLDPRDSLAPKLYPYPKNQSEWGRAWKKEQDGKQP